MHTINDTFLMILRSALLGQTSDVEPAPEQWPELFRLADSHKLLPMIFEAVFPRLRASDPALAARVKAQVRSQVIAQTLRTEEFLALNRKLREAGIDALVVKGIVCRSLYPRPDHRLSADEDVLIRPEQFDKSHQVMTAFGMNTAESDPSAYEVPYRKPGSPLYIELHKHLFPPQSEAYGDLNRFFRSSHDHAVSLEVPGGTVRTLEPTEHLFYLICHAFKHFLHSGFGIRQVCDIVLFANHYGSSIDWDVLLENCWAIRADRFAAAIFRIGSCHLTFDPDRAGYPPAWREIAVDEGPMLEDLLCAGIYGSAQRSRLHSSSITLNAVAAEKQSKRSGALSTIFPPARKLTGRYPYLKKHPYLLPAAWCSRLVTYAKETRQLQGNRTADALKLGAERIELLKQYGILR